MDIIMEFCRRHDVIISVNYQLAEGFYRIWMVKDHKKICHIISTNELELIRDKNEAISYHLECMFKKLKEGKGKDVGTD